MSWNDPHLQREENRIKTTFATTRESKLKNLESDGELFGNTKGIIYEQQII